MDHYDHIESWKELEKLSDEGKVKSIGVSNYTKEHLENLYNNCRIKPAVNQIECHVHLPHATLVKYCKSKNINVMAYAPLGTPTRPNFMANKIPDPILFEDPLLAELWEEVQENSGTGRDICEILCIKLSNVTLLLIALRWLIQRGIIAIPKSVTPSRMKENIDIFNIEPCAADMQRINTIKTRTWYLSYRDIGLLKHQDYITYPMD